MKQPAGNSCTHGTHHMPHTRGWEQHCVHTRWTTQWVWARFTATASLTLVVVNL